MRNPKSSITNWLAALLCLLALSWVHGDELSDGFLAPPPGARPWVYWLWLHADTTPEAITKDLEEMRAKGIEGFMLYDCGSGNIEKNGFTMALQGKGYRRVRTTIFDGSYNTPVPAPMLMTWTPLWRERIRTVAREAGRLGIKFCLTAGLASTSGAISPEDGQQRLVWSETTLNGPRVCDEVLPEPADAVPATAVPPKPNGSAPRMKKVTRGLREVAVLAVPDRDECRLEEVTDLSTKLDASGRLHWEVPAGAWKVLRFAYTPTGARNNWGLFTDGMSAAALDKTWEVTMGPLLKEMSPEERKGLTGIEDDSWEAGETTWTGQFAAGFQRLRHYDLIPWLPVLAGRSVGTREQSEGVRRDFYRTIADLVAVNHYGHLNELANRAGLTCFAEAAGPNTAQLDLMLNCKQVDHAMAEFWMPSVHRPDPTLRFLARNAANANHLYGGRVTPCEALTSVGPFWEESLFDFKNTLDQGFCDGCNLPVLLGFSHSPSVTAKPGYVIWAGTHFNRNVTWWEHVPAFTAYAGRCSFLLQQGLFVADALYYQGDSIGHGEPMKTVPALPAPGYDHDNCNLDALLTRVSVRDGRLVLPDGMSYRVLVLPNNSPLAPEALEKIAALVEGGATVVGPRPGGMAGLPVSAPEKAKFDALVARLWGNDAPANGAVGRGRVMADVPPVEGLQKLGVAPDLEYRGVSEGGELDWIHRTVGGAEVYFMASRWDPPEKITATFRVSGKQPELWNPITGEIRDAAAFYQQDGRTVVPLEFNPRGSGFVVFRRPLTPGATGTAATNYPRTHVSIEMNGPWEVSFDPAWGGPVQVVFDALTDWTKRPEEGIQHYSGTAVYRKSFHLDAMPAPGEKALLDLGEVHESATVRLNGKDLGVVWTQPARVDVTSALRAGDNQLEVGVVNLWPNRLIGDEGQPPEKRLTMTNMHRFNKATPLYPSGLLGPVRLEQTGR